MTLKIIFRDFHYQLRMKKYKYAIIFKIISVLIFIEIVKPTIYE